MNSPKKFPIGAALYWVSLALCALVVSANDFSFAGNGYFVNENQPCPVSETRCPKCSSLGVFIKVYHNMAGITVFREGEKPGGDYHYNGVESIACYQHAICQVTAQYADHRCDPENGCVKGDSTGGCQDLVQEDWRTVYIPRKKWGHISEE